MTIDSKEELEEFVNETSSEVKKLRSELDGVVNMQKVLSLPTDNREIDLAGLWRWLKAVKSRNFEKIKECGSFQVREKSDGDVNVKWEYEDGNVTKATLGTPLTGDDSAGTGSYAIPTRLYDDVLRRIFMVRSEVIPALTTFRMQGRLYRLPVQDDVIEFTHVSEEQTDKTETLSTVTYKGSRSRNIRVLHIGE
jgi:NAD-dependent DNA ligase